MDVENLPRTIELCRGEAGLRARIVDQKALPEELLYKDLTTADEMIDAIKDLSLRGAPAIGVGGASALALFAWNESSAKTPHDLIAELEAVAPRVAQARPTAVNLEGGVGRIMRVAQDSAASGCSLAGLKQALAACVDRMIAEDEAANRAIGEQGALLLQPDSTVLTHCNAGSLATVFYGTALGVVYAAHKQGKIKRVYADETRPVGQGSRLTFWELCRAGVPTTLICDNMAASVMEKGLIDVVIVGGDRICSNGDTANKVGTYGLAVLARYHGIPFYIAAPSTSLDMGLEAGNRIVIEQRPASEVTEFIPQGGAVYNPAFDVTPADLITGIITEHGVFLPSELKHRYLVH